MKRRTALVRWGGDYTGWPFAERRPVDDAVWRFVRWADYAIPVRCITPEFPTSALTPGPFTTICGAAESGS